MIARATTIMPNLNIHKIIDSTSSDLRRNSTPQHMRYTCAGVPQAKFILKYVSMVLTLVSRIGEERYGGVDGG